LAFEQAEITSIREALRRFKTNGSEMD